MRLLVSVAGAAEAAAAVAGGADVIDAKDPYAGALGPVSLDVFRNIHAAVAGAYPVSAALGDAASEAMVARDAQAFVAAGARFVKVGFEGIGSAERLEALIAAAIHGAAQGASTLPLPSLQAIAAGGDRLRSPRDRNAAGRHDGAMPASLPAAIHDGLQPDVHPDLPANGGVVVVAYADSASPAAPAPMTLVEIAARAGAAGVLLDTANKEGPGLRALVSPSVLAAWVAAAHDAGLTVALAGKLIAGDLAFVRDTGADIAGVRGAACDTGRTGRVTTERVRYLRSLV